MSQLLQLLQDSFWSFFTEERFGQYHTEFVPGSIQLVDAATMNIQDYTQLFSENCTLSPGVYQDGKECGIVIIRRRPGSFDSDLKIWKMDINIDSMDIVVKEIPKPSEPLKKTYDMLSYKASSIIWTLSDQVRSKVIWKCIKNQFGVKLQVVLKHKANKTRSLDKTRLPIPQVDNIKTHYSKSILLEDVSVLEEGQYLFKYFYHGITNNAAYRIIGLFISRYAYLYITLHNNPTTNALEIKSLSVGLTADDIRDKLAREDEASGEESVDDTDDPFGGSDRIESKNQIASTYEIEQAYLNKVIRIYNAKSTNLRKGGFGQTRKYTNIHIIPMRPNKFNGKFTELIFPMLVSTKIDGVRCQLRYEKNRWLPYSRAGIILYNVDSLIQLANDFPKILRNYILNIEVYYDKSTLGEVSGALNSDIPPENHYGRLNYALFDMTPIGKTYDSLVFDEETKELIKKTMSQPTHKERILNVLQTSLWFRTQVNPLMKMISAVPINTVLNQTDLKNYYKAIIDLNGEGVVMILNKDGLFKPGRCKTMVKWKATVDLEITVADIIGGTGKNSKRGIIQFFYEGKEYKASIQGTTEFAEQVLVEKTKYKNKKATIRVTGTNTKTVDIRHPIVVAFNVNK